MDIKGYPIDSDFFTGLQLNLTCNIQVSLDISPSMTFFTEWSKSGSPLSSNTRVNVGMSPVLVEERQYQTNVSFNSLDKTIDEGEYMCTVHVIFSLEGYQDITTESIANHSLTIPSKSVTLIYT